MLLYKWWKIGEEKIPLSYAPWRIKSGLRYTINQDREWNWFNTFHYDLDPLRVKSHFDQHYLKEIPSDLILGLAHVELQGHVSIFSLVPRTQSV